MLSLAVIALGATLAAAQNNFPPPPVLLTTTKSGVLPVLPTPFSGVLTLEGAIITKAPVNSSHTGVLGAAIAQTNQPAAEFVATLPAVAFDSLTGTTPTGYIKAVTNAGDTGVTFTVQITNLPDLATYGPFGYHVHDMIVPTTGNCTATTGHFDVTNVGEYYTCDTTNPQNCQTGDLAGKHGKINATSASLTFTEKYLSLDPTSLYYIGAKSIVIHTGNTTRLTCANFVSGSSTTTGGATTTSQVVSFTGAANKVAAGGAVAGLAAVVGLLL